MPVTVNRPTAACSDGSAFIISVCSLSVISYTDVGTLEYRLLYLSAKIPPIFPRHLIIPPSRRRYGVS